MSFLDDDISAVKPAGACIAGVKAKGPAETAGAGDSPAVVSVFGKGGSVSLPRAGVAAERESSVGAAVSAPCAGKTGADSAASIVGVACSAGSWETAVVVFAAGMVSFGICKPLINRQTYRQTAQSAKGIGVKMDPLPLRKE